MCIPKTEFREVGDLKTESNGFIDLQTEDRHLNWTPLRFGENTNRDIQREIPIPDTEITGNFQVLTFLDDIIIVRNNS